MSDVSTLKPPPPAGYKQCAKAPLGYGTSKLYLAHSAQPTSYPYWQAEMWEEMGTDVTYYRVIGQGGEVYWEYPNEIECGSASVPEGTGTKVAKIKALQDRLNKQFKSHPYYPLKVDGVFGPKTCTAAYQYQRTVVGIESVRLTEALFEKLGLPKWYTSSLEVGCTPWYTAVGEPAPVPAPTPTPDPDPEPEPDPDPTIDSKPFPWLEVILGAASGGVGGLAVEKTGKVRVSKQAAGGVGVLLGGVLGFVVGKMRQA